MFTFAAIKNRVNLKNQTYKRFGGFLKPHSPAKFLVDPSGSVVPFPVGLEDSINYPVYKIGMDALQLYLSDWARNSEKINQAQETYTKVHRPHLMKTCQGAWVACSSHGDLLMAPTEKVVQELARKFFQPADRSVDYFMACMGSEFVTLASTGNENFNLLGTNSARTRTLLWKKRNGEARSVVDGEPSFQGEFSTDCGKTFSTHQMKHITDERKFDLPPDIFDQLFLRRGRDDMLLRDPGGAVVKVNVYKELHIRVQGL